MCGSGSGHHQPACGLLTPAKRQGGRVVLEEEPPGFVHKAKTPLLITASSAVEALHRQETNDSLERLVEANTLLSGLGFESSGLAAAHAVHNGLTTVAGTHRFMHGEKVAFGVITQLMLESQPAAVVNEVLTFSRTVGLPTTFAEVGIANPSRELLEMIAQRATAAGETVHNEPFPVTPPLVVAAMLTADSADTAFLHRSQR